MADYQSGSITGVYLSPICDRRERYVPAQSDTVSRVLLHTIRYGQQVRLRVRW